MQMTKEHKRIQDCTYEGMDGGGAGPRGPGAGGAPLAGRGRPPGAGGGAAGPRLGGPGAAPPGAPGGGRAPGGGPPGFPPCPPGFAAGAIGEIGRIQSVLTGGGAGLYVVAIETSEMILRAS